MKQLRAYFILSFLISCAPALERGNWEEEPYNALSKLLSDGYLKGGYAVFDCDNTAILHDVTHTLMVYQIENLEFAEAVDYKFLCGLPRTDFILDDLGLTAEQMGSRLYGQYVHLKELLSEGKTLDDIHSESEYMDFRAGFLAFYKAIGRNYDYDVLCLWEPMLFYGLPKEVAVKSLEYWLSQGRAWNEEWVSPDGRFKGVAEKGIVISQDMKNLMASLRRAGITPYICSASPEWLVEALACTPANGLGFRPDEVYGVRFCETRYEEAYEQPFMEGKVACINTYIAPLHDNREPAMVAGDSSGDIAMLTSFEGMRIGLIMNQGRGGEIEMLANIKDGRYVSQTVVIDYERI